MFNFKVQIPIITYKCYNFLIVSRETQFESGLYQIKYTKNNGFLHLNLQIDG